MGIITLPRRQVRYTAPGSRLNRAHPLTRNLVFCIAPAAHGAGAAVDLVRDGRASTAAQWYGDPNGVGARDWAFSAGDTDDLNWTAGAFTVGVLCRVLITPPSGQGSDIIVRKRYSSESDNEGWGIGQNAPNAGADPSKFLWQSFRDNGFANYNLASTTTQAPGPWFLVGTSDGTTRRFYVNGVEESNTTNNPTPVGQSTNGVANTSSSNDGQVVVHIAYAWNRELGAAEIRELNNNPFQVLRYPDPFRFIAAEAGAPVIPPPTDSWYGRVDGLPFVEPVEVVAF